MTAVAAGQIDCIELLLESEANLKSRDVRMRSCLHLAILNEREEALCFLLRKAGPELVNSPDVEGRSPLHHAITSANEKVWKIT